MCRVFGAVFQVMLKYLRYIFIWLGIVFILFVVICYYYVQAGGKIFLERRFSRFFQQPCAIGEVRFLLPVGLKFKNLEVQNFIKAEDVEFQLGFPFVFDKQLIIQKLVLKNAVFTGVYDELKDFQFGGQYLAKKEEALRENFEADVPFLKGLRIDYFDVENGSIEIFSFAHGVSDRYFADQIRLKALDVSYPLREQRVKFDLKAFIQKGFGLFDRGMVVSEGWVNWPKRNLNSKIDFTDDRQFSRIQIEAKSENNDLKVSGSVQWDTSKLDQAEKADIEKAGGEFAGGLAVGILGLSSGGQALEFSFETKLDDPHLTAVNLTGSVNLQIPSFEPQEAAGPVKPFEFLGNAGGKEKGK